jgi:hypothetical protein
MYSEGFKMQFSSLLPLTQMISLHSVRRTALPLSRDRRHASSIPFYASPPARAAAAS